jgi:5-methylcytosine-specific restriction endonuclease McrA
MANHKTGRVIQCAKCGTDIYKSAFQLKRGEKFCSSECRYSAPRPHRNNGEILICKICKISYYRKASQIKNGVNKTCSIECRNQYLSGERNHFYKQFSEIPKRPRQWTAKQRTEWLADRCVRCGATERLELDHIIPRGPHVQENTQTLCRACNQRKTWNEDRLYYKYAYSGAKR